MDLIDYYYCSIILLFIQPNQSSSRDKIKNLLKIILIKFFIPQFTLTCITQGPKNVSYILHHYINEKRNFRYKMFQVIPYDLGIKSCRNLQQNVAMKENTMSLKFKHDTLKISDV